MDNEVVEKVDSVDAEQGTEQNVKEPAYTQADLDREADRRVQKALQTANEKWEQQAKEREAKAADKAAELASLSAKERQEKEEADRLAALEKREKEQDMREYRYTAKTELETAGLPETFVDMALSDDVETTKNNIEALAKAFDSALEAKVNERLAGNTPKVGVGVSGNADPFDNAISRVLGK